MGVAESVLFISPPQEPIMKIAENCVVTIHFKLTDDDGQELDSSAGKEPLEYLHGANSIIPGLEDALAGRDEGEQVQVTLQPYEAYGPVRPELIDTVPHSAFEGLEVQPGMQFQAEGPKGESRRILVTEVSDEGVTVDANHPLAGQVLHFDLSVEAVREATDEEIDHGHPHG